MILSTASTKQASDFNCIERLKTEVNEYKKENEKTNHATNES